MGTSLRLPNLARIDAIKSNSIVLSEARHLLVTLEMRVPLIAAALRKAQGFTGRADLSNFPGIVLMEAAYAARVQAHGYEVLRDCASARG